MRLLAESETTPIQFLKLYSKLSEKGNKFENEGMMDKVIECYSESIRYYYLYSIDRNQVVCKCDSMETLLNKYFDSDQLDKYVELKERK